MADSQLERGEWQTYSWEEMILGLEEKSNMGEREREGRVDRGNRIKVPHMLVRRWHTSLSLYYI